LEPPSVVNAQERTRCFVRNWRKSMSQSVNKVILVGFLGGSPEVRFTAQGKAVARFSLAVNERWKDSEGAPQETVQWFRIVSFGRLAEICGEYLTKGRQVFIEGKLQCRAWEDRSGEKRKSIEVVAHEMRILDSMNKNGGGTPTPVQAQAPRDEEAPF
jgi:single-strand DNA-binding protein